MNSYSVDTRELHFTDSVAESLLQTIPHQVQSVLEGFYDIPGFVNPLDYIPQGYDNERYWSSPWVTTTADRDQGRNRPFFQTEQELRVFTGMARVLAEGSPIKGAFNALSNYVVQKGFTYTATAKDKQYKELAVQVQTFLDEWLERNEWTADFQREMFIRTIRDGELFCGLWYSGEGMSDMRTIDPVQVTQPSGGRQIEDEYLHYDHPSDWTFGVHTDEDDVQTRHGIYVQWSNRDTDWDYLPGGNHPLYPNDRDVQYYQHLKVNTDRNVKRGMSDLFSESELVPLIRKVLRNTGEGAGLQAAVAWIEEEIAGLTGDQVRNALAAKATQTGRTINGSPENIRHYPPGTIARVQNGRQYKPGPGQAERGQHFILVYEALCRALAIRWSMPEHLITGSAANNNFASILVAGDPFVLNCESAQQRIVDSQRQLLMKVLFWAVRGGVFGDISWQLFKRVIQLLIEPPSVAVRDRDKETDRLLKLHQAGVISRKRFSTLEGEDDEQNQEDLKTEAPTQPTIGPEGFGNEPGGDEGGGGDDNGPDDSSPPGSLGGESIESVKEDASSVPFRHAAMDRVLSDWGPELSVAVAAQWGDVLETYDESKHKRDSRGRYAHTASVDSEGFGKAIDDKDGFTSYAGIHENEWQDWAYFEPEINSRPNELKVGQVSSQGQPLTAEDIKGFKSLHDKIQSAASSNYVKGVFALYRGESYPDMAAVNARYGGRKKIKLSKLTSTATRPEQAADYAREESGGPVHVLLAFSGNGGIQGIGTSPLGVPGGEVVMPEGAEFSVVGIKRQGNTVAVELYNKNPPVGQAVKDQHAPKEGYGGKEGLLGFLQTKTESVQESYDESKHPRDDHGRFITVAAIAAAQKDPAKAEKLRKKVTEPKERAKLNKLLGGTGGEDNYSASERPSKLGKSSSWTPDTVVYHGGKGGIELDPTITGTATGNPTAVWGAFFTPSRPEAERYLKDFHQGSGKVHAAKLLLKNPYRMSFGEYERFVKLDLGAGDLDKQMEANRQKAIEFKKQLLAKGHDGIVIGEGGKARPQELVAFEKPQIKAEKS